MEDDEAERQRKLKAGREKLLQFQQKKRGVKKKKKGSGTKSAQSEQQTQGESPTSEHGAKTTSVTSETHSAASADTDKDVSSIASELEEKLPTDQEQIAVRAVSEGESTESFAGESCTSGDESYTGTSEDGCVDDFVIANLERNELKSRTVELEEQLAARTTALKDVSKENAELKSRLENITVQSPSFVGTENTPDEPERDAKMKKMESDIIEKETRMNELLAENNRLQKVLDQAEDVKTSGIEEIQQQLVSNNTLVMEMRKQNTSLTEEMDDLKKKLTAYQKDVQQLSESLAVKENSLQQFNTENENQKMKIVTMKDIIRQNEAQLIDQKRELAETAGLKEYCENMKHNVLQLEEQLSTKDHTLQMITQEHDNATQEINRLQQEMNKNHDEHSRLEYERKLSDVTQKLNETENALLQLQKQYEIANQLQAEQQQEISVLKQQNQENIEKFSSAEELLSSTRHLLEEKEQRMSLLEQQINSFSQAHEELSLHNEQAGQNVLQLENLLNEKNQDIGKLEISVRDVTEERDLMRDQMQQNSEELLKQINNLRVQLDESNVRIKQQGDEMESSFSELGTTQDMIKELQQEMLEKEQSLKNLNQSLQDAEREHHETVESLQLNFVKEKQLIQCELEERETMLTGLKKSMTDLEELLSAEKQACSELKSENSRLREQTENLIEFLKTKEDELAIIRQDSSKMIDEHKVQVESLKLEMENLKESAPDVNKIVSDTSQRYEAQIAALKEQQETRVRELSDKCEAQEQEIARLQTEQVAAFEQFGNFKERFGITETEREEALTKLEAALEKHKELEECYTNKFEEEKLHHEQEVAALKAQHESELLELQSSQSTVLQEYDNMISNANRNHEEQLTELRDLLEGQRLALQNKDRVLEDNEAKLNDLNEQLNQERVKNKEISKTIDELMMEKNELLSKEIGMANEREVLVNSNQVTDLVEKIKSFEDEISAAQARELRLSEDNKHYRELLRETETNKKRELSAMSEEFVRREEQHRDEMDGLGNQLKQLEKSREETITMLEQTQAELGEVKQRFNENEQEKLQEEDDLHPVDSRVHDMEAELQEVKERLQTSEDKYCETLENLQQSEQELLRNKDTLEELQVTLAENNNQLREKDEKIQSIDNELRNRENEIREARTRYHDSLEDLRKKDKELREKDEILSEYEDEFRAKEEEILVYKEELKGKTKELRSKEDKYKKEIKLMDNQLEQTRRVIENVRSSNEKNLKETVAHNREVFEKELELIKEEHDRAIENMRNVNEELRNELDKEKLDAANMKIQLEDLNKEKEVVQSRVKELEDFDWTSNSFVQEPVVSQSVVETVSCSDDQMSEDTPTAIVENTSGTEAVDNQTTVVHGSELRTPDQLDLLRRISVLQEKLAEKEQSILELVEEKNKLLKIVKDYNDSLTSERDGLKQKIMNQDRTIEGLQEQLSTSELVSSDLQEMFGRQLLLLQGQRDSLLGQLEEERNDRSSFVGILEEKHALEENLRTEKENLSEKLRQKEMLESQLEQERGALQEQLIRQARLNEIIREKDNLEVELMEQKNRLETELSNIEKSLAEKERLLRIERDALQTELQDKDKQLRFRETKELELIEEREQLERAYNETLLATRTELESTYEESLDHLKTELDLGYRQRLLNLENEYQSQHEQEIEHLVRQHEQQVVGLKAEYEERIKNIQRDLEEQRRKQVITMKSVLERDREEEVGQVKEGHNEDMEELRKELNKRHQDIVSTIVDKLKKSHAKEMEDCLAGAVTETVLKVEAARLEVEQEYGGKFEEVRDKAKHEIENLKTRHAEEMQKLVEKCEERVENMAKSAKLDKNEALEKMREEYETEHQKVERLQKTNETSLQQLADEHQVILTSLRSTLDAEREDALRRLREEIEIEHDEELENLQDELQEKYESSLKELREELEKRCREITQSAVEELQQKHFSDIEVLKREHEHTYQQMSNTQTKLETDYKQEIVDYERRLHEAQEMLHAMEARTEKSEFESMESEGERIQKLKESLGQKITFIQQEHAETLKDVQRQTEKLILQKEEEFADASRQMREEVEKEKINTNLKHIKELEELNLSNDKRIFDKEQEHAIAIKELQHKLDLLEEENDEARFRELEENQRQLSEKYQSDLEAIVRELKMKHEKQIDVLLAEAETDRENAEAAEFGQWKDSIIEKHHFEIGEIQGKHQKELEEIRKELEADKIAEVKKVIAALSSKHQEELSELRSSLEKEGKEELEKIMLQNKNFYDSELAAHNQSLKAEHEEAVSKLREKLMEKFAKELEQEGAQLRVYKDTAQEREMEIEELKRNHQKTIQQLKQGNFDDLLEEVAQIRSNLALDAAREIELVKMESDYQLAKKVKELTEAHEKEVAALRDEYQKREQSNAEEIENSKRQLDIENEQLKQMHKREMDDLETQLTASHDNSLDDLRQQFIRDMEEMRDSLTNTSEKQNEEFRKQEVLLQEERTKLEDIVVKLQQDQKLELLRLEETLNSENERALEKLKQEHLRQLNEANEQFALQLNSQKENFETEKAKDMAALEEEMKLIREQHEAELETLRQELVETHMKKFTLMTGELEKAHQEEIQQLEQKVRSSLREQFETELKQAEELVRYNMEQKHLELLKQLEENLLKKHEGQIDMLKEVLRGHQDQIEILKSEHEVEKQNIINDHQSKQSDTLTTVKRLHEDEIAGKDALINELETQIERLELEVRNKEKTLNDMNDHIAKTNDEYEGRLSRIRREFDEKLEEMSEDFSGSSEEQIRGIQELLTKQHAEQLKERKDAHDEQISILNKELEDARNLKEKLGKDYEQALSEYKVISDERDTAYKNEIEEERLKLTNSGLQVKELKEENDNLNKLLQEKEKNLKQLAEQKEALDLERRSLEETVREMMNRHEREKLEDSNMIKMLNADLDNLNSERDGIRRAKENLMRLLSSVVRNTLITEETINSRLETLLEETQRADGGDATLSEVHSISEDSTPLGFRQRPTGQALASSTPAAPPMPRYNEDVDNGDDDPTLTNDGAKETEASLASDEGLELSAVLSENTLQGSLDVQNEEAIVDSGNRLRLAVQKILDMVASVTQQLQNARTTQDELFNTTEQKAVELGQLSQAQKLLMARLEEEIETKEQVTNRLRKAEEEMEAYIAEIDRLEKLQKQDMSDQAEHTDDAFREQQQEIENLKKEKEQLLKSIEDRDREVEPVTKVETSDVAVGGDVVPSDQDDSAEALKLECFRHRQENDELRRTRQQLLEKLEEVKLQYQNELSMKDKELIQKRRNCLEEIHRLKVASANIQNALKTDRDSILTENDNLIENIKELNTTVQSLSEEKRSLQMSLEQRDVMWEDEKNALEQQLYDSCLEASSLKEKLKSRSGDEDISDLKQQIMKQDEACRELELNVASLQDLVTKLNADLNAKVNEIDILNEHIAQQKEDQFHQQNLIDEQKEHIFRAKNTELAYKEEISSLNEALSESEKRLELSNVKVRELSTNLKNMEDTYNAKSMESTQRLNEKIDQLQNELNRTRTTLEQNKKQSNFSIGNHIAELKQLHNEEIQALRRQFESDIQEAIERTKIAAENNNNIFTKDTEQECFEDTERSIYNDDETAGTRLEIQLRNVDHFTNTIAGYLSNIPPLNQDILNEKEDDDDSMRLKIHSLLDNVKLDADAIYTLVNSIPPVHDSNIKSLQMAWDEERNIFLQAIKQLKEIAFQGHEKASKDGGWRETIMGAVLDIMNKEEQMLTSELQAIERLTRVDAVESSNLVKQRQEKQINLHRESLEKLYETDRALLTNEISDLQRTLSNVKQELTHENQKLQTRLESIQEHVQRREDEFVQQVESRENTIHQERGKVNELRAKHAHDNDRLRQAEDVIKRERALVKDLQDVLNKNKARLTSLETTIQNEKTQGAIIQTCLDSERARCSNLEEALKRERANTELKESELEEKNKLLQSVLSEEKENIDNLKNAVLQGKQEISHLQSRLAEATEKNTELEKEILDNKNNALSNSERQTELIRVLKEDLQDEKSRNDNLMKNIEEQRKASEELKSTIGPNQEINEQIAERDQFITDLSKALDNERKVNEELRNALDNEYESPEKINDHQINVIKELKTSLTAVQNQLRNQIDVVDEERVRAKRLRNERDIHEATALGAREKESLLQTKIELERAGHNSEISNLKDVIERQVSEKLKLEEKIERQSAEFNVLCTELQRLKEKDGSDRRESPTSPSRDRYHVLRHDLKSVVDEHRVLLILHKDYLKQQPKTAKNSTETGAFLKNIETLLKELDKIKALLTATPDAPQIPLSAIKTAAYDRVTKQNEELSNYIAKLTKEKEEFRVALSCLEHQVTDYQDREAIFQKDSRRDKHELENILNAERARFDYERSRLSQMLDDHKRRIEDLEDRLRQKDNELSLANQNLRQTQDELEKYTAIANRLHSTENLCGRWTMGKIQKLYGKYMKAEKSRKSLAYQKKYLVLMLGGFRESESNTLSLIAKMGARPSFQQSPPRFPPAFTRFRTVVRVVIAVKRMSLLVRKSKLSLRQITDLYDRNSERSRPSDPRARQRQHERRPTHSQASYQPDSSSFSNADMNSYAEGNNSFASGHHSAASYSSADTGHSFATHSTNPRSSQYHNGPAHLSNTSNSPPVKDVSSRRTSSPNTRSPGQTRQQDLYNRRKTSPDLERKIRNLDNLQQKLSVVRGDQARRF